ncbi:programmed cell death protein 2 [Lactarius pseudohatsudake]|nr:programmed cell death protein 2 [Lactarius pseudohatsudake]
MASPEQQDWSDSDDDDPSQVETSVLLGIPDGAIESPSDLKDAAVSRIGGLPVRLVPTHTFPSDSSHCRYCKNPMELLVQLWAPLQDSPYDRAVYVWGCAKSSCQRMSGSVRAWRSLRYNEDYASKLERKFARKRPHGAVQSELDARTTYHGVNPFAMSGNINNAANSGIGSDMFDSMAQPGPPGAITSHVSASEEEENADSDGDSASTSSSLVLALASATLTDSSWDLSPLYAPQYLSTISEYIPYPKKAPDEHAVGAAPDVGAGQESQTWTSEKYENSMHTDHVFDGFNGRVTHEPQQCVRYDLGGIPMPFADDDVYKQLFPLLPGTPGLATVTKSVFNVSSPRRGYDATSIPSCPHCGSRRVFECQLMPNLINILGTGSSADGDRATTEEERKEVVRKLLKGEAHGHGMEWGTILVFSCEKDCCLGLGNKEKQDAWSEELALVQWDI